AIFRIVPPDRPSWRPGGTIRDRCRVSRTPSVVSIPLGTRGALHFLAQQRAPRLRRVTPRSLTIVTRLDPPGNCPISDLSESLSDQARIRCRPRPRRHLLSGPVYSPLGPCPPPPWQRQGGAYRRPDAPIAGGLGNERGGERPGIVDCRLDVGGRIGRDRAA